MEPATTLQHSPHPKCRLRGLPPCLSTLPFLPVRTHTLNGPFPLSAAPYPRPHCRPGQAQESQHKPTRPEYHISSGGQKTLLPDATG